jgi:hypothetical protein
MDEDLLEELAWGNDTIPELEGITIPNEVIPPVTQVAKATGEKEGIENSINDLNQQIINLNQQIQQNNQQIINLHQQQVVFNQAIVDAIGDLAGGDILEYIKRNFEDPRIQQYNQQTQNIQQQLLAQQQNLQQLQQQLPNLQGQLATANAQLATLQQANPGISFEKYLKYKKKYLKLKENRV